MKKERKEKRNSRSLMLGLIMMLLVIGITGSASLVHAANKIGYVNHYYLNLRQENSSVSTIIVKLAENDQLEILEELGDWYKVNATHEGKVYQGYVYYEYVTFEKPQGSSSTDNYIAVVKNSVLNLRRSASLSSGIVVKLSKNDKLEILSYKDSFYQVNALHNGKVYKGYVAENYITFNAPAAGESIGYVNNDTLNLRKGPGTEYDIVKKLGQYDQMIIREKKGDWYRVTATYDGIRYNGYVLGSYVKIGTLNLNSVTPSGYANLTLLNLRRFPGTSEAIIVRLKKNEKIYCVAKENGWWRVAAVHSGKVYYGYVMEKYVRKYVAPTATPTPKPTATPTPKPTATPIPSNPTEKVVYVKSTQLNLRKEPVSNSIIVMVLTKNDKLVVKNTIGTEWYQVVASHNNETYTGYVRQEYTKTVQTSTAGKINTTGVKLYYGASETANIIVTLAKGDGVIVTAKSGEWSQIIVTHGNKLYEGYIQSKYITAA